MSWITITVDHVRARLAEEELLGIEATGGGTGDRLTPILDQVTALVRSKVAGCHKNDLGPSGTIPDECLHAAATIAKHDVRGSLPSTGSADEGDIRREEYRSAMDFLNDVATCKIGIENISGDIGGRSSGCYGGDPKYQF